MTREPRDAPQFFLTSQSPCPYLPNLQERKVFTHIIGRNARRLNQTLTEVGFRRSQTIAYRPACEGCAACVSVRVLADVFHPSKTQRRLMATNSDIEANMRPATADHENYALFRQYIDLRHNNGGMADMNFVDFAMMIEDSHVDTRLVEYRRKSDGALLACCLTDFLEDGLSMVYSFYACDAPRRSLGVYMILDHIERARSMGLAYVYLGYWVDGSPKMAYKANYAPQERLGRLGWELTL